MRYHFNKNIYYIIILIFFIFSCSERKHKSYTNATQAVPIKSNLIIEIHDIIKTHEKMQKFPWWKNLCNMYDGEYLNLLKTVQHDKEFRYIFDNRKIYLSAILTNNSQPDFLVTTSITNTESTIHQLIQKFQKNDHEEKYEGAKIKKLKISNEENDFFYTIHNNIFMLSFSKILIQESIRQLNNNIDIFQSNPIKNLNQNLPKYSDLNILVKTTLVEKMIGHNNIFLNANTWSLFDIELEENIIMLNGVTNRGNITYLKDNEYSNSKKSNIQNILPRHISGFYKYQVNNYTDLNNVMQAINTTENNQPNYQLSNSKWFPSEINIAYNDNVFSKTSYLIFQANNYQECLKYLNNYTKPDFQKYLDYTIKEVRKENILKNDWLKHITKKWSEMYYIIIDGYFVCSHSYQNIKTLINNISSNQTIANSQALNTINNKLGKKSHTSFYLNFKNPNEQWKQIFNSIVSKNIASKDYFFNSIILLQKNMDFENLTEWNVNLETETNYKPQLVRNHYTKNLEIISQDIENNIYLIDNNGKLLWKKKIGSSIIGDIHQIDRYNNRKLQYLFNTKDSVYIIDRNGKYVDPFPIKSKYTMSIPLALFDYDNTQNYRILITMNNTLTMYNQKGEIVTGWEFTNTESNIIITPEHYQLFNKDYIIISEQNGKTHFLNRKGQSRIGLAKKAYISTNTKSLIKAPSLKESKLIAKDIKGQIIYLYFDGTIDTLDAKNLHNNDHYVKSNEHTIIIKEGDMTYKSQHNEFEYNFKTDILSSPKIMLHHDSILIAIHNKSENLIYLFKETGELYAPPFFGNTDFSIGKLREEKGLNLIVGSAEGLIYNYKIY